MELGDGEGGSGRKRVIKGVKTGSVRNVDGAGRGGGGGGGDGA